MNNLSKLFSDVSAQFENLRNPSLPVELFLTQNLFLDTISTFFNPLSIVVWDDEMVLQRVHIERTNE